MTPYPFMPLYIADYIADTPHLTTQQHGAYLLLIASYWQQGRPLNAANGRLAAVARLSNDEWAAMEPTLAEFFEVDGNTWRHPRIDAELAAARTRTEQKRKAGRASAERRSHGRSTLAEQDANVRATSVGRTFNESQSKVHSHMTTLESRAPEGDLSLLRQKLVDAAGDALASEASHPSLAVISIPLRWLDTGCDLDLDVLPTIAARAASKRPRSIKSWSYFDEAVRSARDLRTAPETANGPVGRANGQAPRKRGILDVISTDRGAA